MPPKGKGKGKSRSSSTKSQKAKERKERKLLEERIRNSQEKCDEARSFLEPASKRAEPNYVKAKEAIEAAINIYNMNPQAFFLMGECHRWQKMYQEAIDHYSQALDVDPSYIRALEGRAACFQNLLDLPRAVEDHTSIIELDPTNDHAYNMRGLCVVLSRVPGLRLKMADFKRCEEDFKTAVRLNEANYYALANLGKAYEDQDMLEDALKWYSASVKVKEDYAYAKFRRGCTALAVAVRVLCRNSDVLDAHALNAANVMGFPTSSGQNSGELAKTIGDVEQEVRQNIVTDQERTKARKHLDEAVNDFRALLEPFQEARKMHADPTIPLNLGVCYLLVDDLSKADEQLKYCEDIIAARPGFIAEGEAEAIEDLETIERVLEMRRKEVKDRKQLKAQAEGSG